MLMTDPMVLSPVHLRSNPFLITLNPESVVSTNSYVQVSFRRLWMNGSRPLKASYRWDLPTPV